jgi:hypothetical protein
MKFSALSSLERRFGTRFAGVSGKCASSVVLPQAHAVRPRWMRCSDASEQRGIIITGQSTYIYIGVIGERFGLTPISRSLSANEQSTDCQRNTTTATRFRKAMRRLGLDGGAFGLRPLFLEIDPSASRDEATTWGSRVSYIAKLLIMRENAGI